MDYYKLIWPMSAKIIGGNGQSQIEGIDKGQVPSINDMLYNPTITGLEELSKITFKMRYNAKITDIVSGVMFPSSLFFVNNKTLILFEEFITSQYFNAPAKLDYRGKLLSDYNLFHPITNNEDFVDFASTRFILQHKLNLEVTPFNEEVNSLVEFKEASSLFRITGQRLVAKEISIKKSIKYDYIYYPHLSLGHLFSSDFYHKIIEKKVTGIIFKKLELQ